MSMKCLLTLSATLALLSGNALANPDGMFPNVKETVIPYVSYHYAYENAGPSKDLPKLIVFSPTGMCVGVTDGSTITADKMSNFISDSLRKGRKACDIVLSNKFGVSEPGTNSGTGKPEVMLFVSDSSTRCEACEGFRLALLRDSHGVLAGMHLTITTVAQGKKS